jgi:hypothetical protein
VRVQVRVSLVALVVSALVAVLAPAAAQASFGVEKFFAGNCKESTCGEGAIPPSKGEEETKGYRQPGGNVPFGVTDFVLNNKEGEPEGNVRNIRVDVAPGVVTNPQTVTRCSMVDFTGTELAPGVFLESHCPESSIIGKQFVKVQVGPKTDFPLEGTVYNLEPTNGLASEFGVALELEPLIKEPFFAHTLIEGNVEWASDYHDYFTIKEVSTMFPLVESRLVFEGTKATTEGFLRNPTACTAPGPETKTTLSVESYTGATSSLPYENKVGSEGSGLCNLGFVPSFALETETVKSDSPDGITTNVSTAHPKNISEPDNANLKTAKVVLPEGMTLNPSAAAGLTGCTRAEVGIESRNAVKCHGSSRIGTVELEVPTLPSHSLSGPIFLGQPEEGGAAKPITGPPYTIYLDAESARYGVKVRVEGVVQTNPTTGQIEAKFEDTKATPNNIPQAPFNEAILHFNGGPFASIANPLVCGTGKIQTSFTPFSGSTVSPVSGELPFATEECASPSFAPKQTTTSLPKAGGAESNFTFTLERPEGQQYVSKVSTLLPPGLVGKIPSVTQCTDAQAAATQESGNGCPASSQVGTVQVASGSGSPFTFSGNVYLTEKINGAPYGLVFKVPVVAGPFKFTEEVTIATINVNQRTAQVTVAVTLPTIKDGIPIRVRSMTVDVNRPNYILNPTNCSEFQTESTVTPVTGPGAANGTAVLVKSPFQAEGCSALAFKPTLGASTSGKANKANGASLVTTMTQAPGQSNIKSVLVQLPKQLPSRLTTLQKACLAATFEQNPYSCAKESFVGTASAVTPVLPNVMTGPAILVSHAGEEFPSLELVLEADNVRVIVEGKTHIKSGITTTNFASTPDVPVSSITVSLPLGPFSALAVERTEGPKKTNLCTEKLVMPTTITGQNGVVVKQQTIIAPTQCGVQILKTKVKGDTASVTIETYAAGTVRLHGVDLTTTDKTYTGVKKSVTIKVPLSRKGRQRRRAFKLTLKVSFTPKQKGGPGSSASTAVKFPR